MPKPWSLKSRKYNQGEPQEEAGKLNEWGRVIFLCAFFWCFLPTSNSTFVNKECSNIDLITRFILYIENHWQISQNFKSHLPLIGQLWIRENKVLWGVHQCAKLPAFCWWWVWIKISLDTSVKRTSSEEGICNLNSKGDKYINEKMYYMTTCELSEWKEGVSWVMDFA